LIKSLKKCLIAIIITHEMSVIKEILGRVAIMEKREVIELGRVESVFVKSKE
jgi:ABC-type methionine transport system ATPase subunit